MKGGFVNGEYMNSEEEFYWDLADEIYTKRNKKRKENGIPELYTAEILEQEKNIFSLMEEAFFRSFGEKEMEKIFSLDDVGNWKLPEDYITELIETSVHGIIRDSRKLFSPMDDFTQWFGQEEGADVKFFHYNGLVFAALQEESGLTSLYRMTEDTLQLIFRKNRMDDEMIADAVLCYNQMLLEAGRGYTYEYSPLYEEWRAYVARDAARLDMAGQEPLMWMDILQEDIPDSGIYKEVYETEYGSARTKNLYHPIIAVLQKVRVGYELVYTEWNDTFPEEPDQILDYVSYLEAQRPQQVKALKDLDEKGSISCLQKKLEPGDVIVFVEDLAFHSSCRMMGDGSLAELTGENDPVTPELLDKIRTRMDISQEHACYCSLYSYARAYWLPNLKNKLEESSRFKNLEEYAQFYHFYQAGSERLPEHPVMNLAEKIQEIAFKADKYNRKYINGKEREEQTRNIARKILDSPAIYTETLYQALEEGTVPENLIGEAEKSIIMLEACKSLYNKDQEAAIQRTGPENCYQVLALDENGKLEPVDEEIFGERKEALDFCYRNSLKPVPYKKLADLEASLMEKREIVEIITQLHRDILKLKKQSATKDTLVINLYGAEGTDTAEKVRSFLEEQGYSVPPPVRPAVGTVKGNEEEDLMDFMVGISGIYGTVDFLVTEMPPVAMNQDYGIPMDFENLMISLTGIFNHVNVIVNFGPINPLDHMQLKKDWNLRQLLDQYGLEYYESYEYSREALLKEIMRTHSQMERNFNSPPGMGIPAARYIQDDQGQTVRVWYGKMAEEFGPLERMYFAVDTDIELYGKVSDQTLKILYEAGYLYERGVLVERPREPEVEETKQNFPHGEEKKSGKEINSIMDRKEDTPKEQLMQELKDGIKKTLDSQEFAAWCRQQGRLYYNHYSFRNAILTYLQKPDASYTCGYETWKKYGRQVKQGAEAIKIFSPVFAREYGGKGSLLSAIRKSCRAQMEKNPALEYGTFRLGQSNLYINMYKNNLFDVKFGERCVMAHSTPDIVRKFLDTQIIGKLPVGYNVIPVFDISDTTDDVPYLWVSEKACRPDEMVLDDKGNPIRDRRGHIKIVNSDERRKSFAYPLNPSVTEHDPGKMQLLYSALKAVCVKKGIPVSEVPEKEDQIIADGARGYWRRPDEKHKRGYIVISDNLLPTEKVKVLLHEAAHADLHQDLEKLAEEMGKETLANPKELKEIQAEAVAYMAAATFGLETDHSSFYYISEWSDGRELKALEDSMEVIYRESQKLVREMEESLNEMGLNLLLEPKELQPLTGEQKEKAVSEYMEFVLTAMDENENMQNGALHELKSLRNEEHRNIVQEQIALTYDIDRQLASLHEKIERLEATENPEQQDLLQNQIRAGTERINTAVEKIRALSEERARLSVEAEEKTKDDIARIFADRPMEVLEWLQKEKGLLAQEHENGLKYIASSRYIRENYAGFLAADPEEFAALCQQRLADLQKAMSKNGVAVEVDFCENGSRNLPAAGTLMNPRAANRILAEAEKEIRQSDIPYLKCFLSVYTALNKNNLAVMQFRMDVGDSGQNDLKDYLCQVCDSQEEKNVLGKFEKSLRERSEEKILVPATEVSGKEDMGNASRPIDVWKGMMTSFQKNTDQEERKGEQSRTMECDVKEKS